MVLNPCPETSRERTECFLQNASTVPEFEVGARKDKGKEFGGLSRAGGREKSGISDLLVIRTPAFGGKDSPTRGTALLQVAVA